MSRPFERCANGCDAPPCPPSRVICRACMDRITRTLEAAVAGMNVRAAEREERGKEKGNGE